MLLITYLAMHFFFFTKISDLAKQYLLIPAKALLNIVMVMLRNSQHFLKVKETSWFWYITFPNFNL